MINPCSKMSTVDLIKKKFLWIVLGAIIGIVFTRIALKQKIQS